MRKKRSNGCAYCGKQRQSMQTFYMCLRCRQSQTREGLKAHRLRRHAFNCERLFKAGLNTAEIAKKISKSEAFVYNAMAKKDLSTMHLHTTSVHGAIVQLPHGVGVSGGITTKEEYQHVE